MEKINAVHLNNWIYNLYTKQWEAIDEKLITWRQKSTVLILKELLEQGKNLVALADL